MEILRIRYASPAKNNTAVNISFIFFENYSFKIFFFSKYEKKNEDSFDKRHVLRTCFLARAKAPNWVNGYTICDKKSSFADKQDFTAPVVLLH